MDSLGGHRTVKQTKALLSPYLLTSAEIMQVLHLCVPCAKSRSPMKTVNWDKAPGPRPSRFGEVLAIDFKPIGRFRTVTAQDLYAGILWCVLVSDESAESAKKAVQKLLSFGLPIKNLLFDRAKSFVESENFKSFLDSKAIEGMKSKGYDPTHIASLERSHLELGAYLRSFGDLESLPKADLETRIDGFLEGFNAITLDCGITRRELAFGSTPDRSREISRRLRTLTQSLKDDAKSAGKDDAKSPAAPSDDDEL